MLGGEAQRDPACGEHGEAGSGCKQVGDLECGPDHLLDVVEHQQQFTVSKRVRELLGRRSVAPSSDPKGLSHSGEHEGRVGDRGESNEGHAVRELGAEFFGHPDGEAGLAGAARTGQRQQAHIGAAQQRRDLDRLPLPSDEGRDRDGQRRRVGEVDANGRRGTEGRGTPGSCQQHRSLLRGRAEGVEEQGESVFARGRPDSLLQVAEAAGAQPRALGQLLLRQSSRQPVPPQEVAEAGNIVAFGLDHEHYRPVWIARRPVWIARASLTTCMVGQWMDPRNRGMRGWLRGLRVAVEAP